MSEIPNLRDIPDLPQEIKRAALDGHLILFVGAGTSMLLGLPSWRGMARRQLECLRKRGVLNFSDIEQLNNLNAKKQLSIAVQIAEDKNISLDLTNGLTGFSEGSSIYKSINDIGCVCVTTNYDKLLSPRFSYAQDDSATPATLNRIYEKHRLLTKHLDTPGTVIHLHGAVDDPDNMVVTTREYLKHYDDSHVQAFLSDLFARKTVLFIGYRLEEDEILEHILRRGDARKSYERKRFALQGYYLSEKPLYEKLYNYYQNSFGVHAIGFIRDYKNYKQQEDIFEDWSPKIVVKPPPLAADIDKINEVLGNG